jgi:hypothetical protein
MGGPRYEETDERNSSPLEERFNFQGHASTTDSSRREVHPELNILGKKRECLNSVLAPKTTAIVVAMDVTRSRGDDAKVVFEKLPLLMGQIYMKNYVTDPAISFAAIGDATCGDKAPIQVGQFESDVRLDTVLSNLWLEEGGGGTGQESYELMAYYYAKHSILDCNRRGQKGFFFFIGDEGFYPKVDKNQIKEFIGDELDSDVDSAKAFAELQQKYQVFFIYPRKSWEQRRVDIDAEIQQRVEDAGGQYKNVDIRASLLWNNRNDLDLHVITPTGQHIYYGSKQASCGGFLDVDMNVQGETTKPVENVRWARGKAKKGTYKVYVQNYAFHETSHAATPFKVELEINGKVQHFTGETKANLTGDASNVDISVFEYDPSARQTPAAEESVYSNYDDVKIKNQWSSVIPRENILIIEDPTAIVDVLMGALAISAGTDIEQYLLDMGERGQSQARIQETASSLSALSANTSIAKIDAVGLPGGDVGKKRQGGTKRL